MPYVYAQAKVASQNGHPLLRTLFFEYPEDLTSWFVEDQYLFGTDILVAPLMEDNPGRNVYLPPGHWTDHQTTKTYGGAGWHHITAGEVPVVMLVRDGAAIPHARLVQSTDRIDWGEIELAVYGAGSSAEGLLCLPEDGELHRLNLVRDGDRFVLEDDPLRDTVAWKTSEARINGIEETVRVRHRIQLDPIEDQEAPSWSRSSPRGYWRVGQPNSEPGTGAATTPSSTRRPARYSTSSKTRKGCWAGAPATSSRYTARSRRPEGRSRYWKSHGSIEQ
jgi:hypothetical protein